jgi:hypothetical protein
VSRWGVDPEHVPVKHHALGEVYLTGDGRILTPGQYATEREENNDAREGSSDG